MIPVDPSLTDPRLRAPGYGLVDVGATPADPAPAVPGGAVVDMSQQPVVSDGTTLTPTDSGGMEVDFGGQPQGGAPELMAHPVNLALHLPESVLGTIAERIIEWADADLQSRKDWGDRLTKGFKSVAILADEGKKLAFNGASAIVHPLIMEAAVQFQSRALDELFPASGPVKSSVVGTQSQAIMAQSERVEDFMNYQITVEDNSYFWDVDQMLFYLPFVGSAFKKTWWDTSSNKLRSRFIKGEALLVPYSATSMEDAPRATHVMKKSRNAVLRLMEAGLYRDVELTEPSSTAVTEIDREVLDRADDRSQIEIDGDANHDLLESHCEYIIKGTPEAGKVGLPYVITVERESRKVLSIYRNWREEDKQRNKRAWFTHYKFLPGFGFYGFGFFHTISGLGEAASGAVNALLDAAAFSNMQGGFKSKDVNLKAGEITIEPGVWKDVDATAEDLKNAFFTPPFKEPSEALFKLLGLLTEAGQRFASTTEVMVGDASNRGPVGTTVALIEQGSKTFSAIHKRLHRAAGEEFRLRAELNYEYLPDHYPYLVDGGDKVILRDDFDSRVDVIPVSDPNIFSSTQRIAIAQTTLQIVLADGDTFKRPQKLEAYRRMLSALRVPNPDALLPEDDKPPEPMDPVSEGAALMTGEPVKAYPDQAHDAHIATHMGQLEQIKGSPMEKNVAPAIVSHIAEHYAARYVVQMQQAMGAQIPQPQQDPNNPDAPPQPLPPQVQMQVAMAAAQATPKLPPTQEVQAAQQAQQLEMQKQQAQQAHEAGLKNQEQAFAQWKARLDASTNVVVAEISAATTINQALLDAEQAANTVVASEGEGSTPVQPAQPGPHAQRLAKAMEDFQPGQSTQSKNIHVQRDHTGQMTGAVVQDATGSRNVVVHRDRTGKVIGAVMH